MADVSDPDQVVLYDESGNRLAVVAHPLIGGGRAANANPAAATVGDPVVTMLDLVGKTVVQPCAPRELETGSRLALASTTETTLIAAGGAGVYHDLTLLTISYQSAANQRIDLRASTGGAVVLSVAFAAAGSVMIPIHTPITQAVANNNWTVQATSANTLYVSARAVKNV